MERRLLPRARRPVIVTVSAWAYIVLGASAAALAYAMLITSLWPDQEGKADLYWLNLAVVPMAVVATAIGAIAVAGGRRLLHHDEWWRRVLLNLTAALLPVSLLFAASSTVAAMPDLRALHGRFCTWFELLVVSGSIIVTTALALLLVLLTRRQARAATVPQVSMLEGAREPVAAVLLIGWGATMLGAGFAVVGLALPVVMVMGRSTIPPLSNVEMLPVLVMIAAFSLLPSYWALFGGLALLELREKGRRWLSNGLILFAALTVFGVVAGVLEVARPYLPPQVAQFAPPPGTNGKDHFAERLPCGIAELLLTCQLLLLLRSRSVREAIAAAEAHRAGRPANPPLSGQPVSPPPPKILW